MTDHVRAALEAIDVQLNEMRSLKGWRLNLIRENMAKLHEALALQHVNVGRDEPIRALASPAPNFVEEILAAQRDQIYSVVLKELETKRPMPTSVTLACAITNAIRALLSPSTSEAKP